MIKDSTTTSAVAIADKPLGVDKDKRVYRQFDVSPETFNRFKAGRTKFERWKKYLNLQDDVEKSIYDYHRKNTGSIIILRNSENGALRSIRPKAANE
jgi:hypothetical protein